MTSMRKRKNLYLQSEQGVLEVGRKEDASGWKRRGTECKQKRAQHGDMTHLWGLLSPERPIPTTSTSITPNRSPPQHSGHSSAENPHHLSNTLRKNKTPSAGLTRSCLSQLWPSTWLSSPATSGTSYLHAKLVPSRAGAALRPASELLCLRLKRFPSDPPSHPLSHKSYLFIRMWFKHLHLPRPQHPTRAHTSLSLISDPSSGSPSSLRGPPFRTRPSLCYNH